MTQNRKLQSRERKLQKYLFNLPDTELLETYCHEGFVIDEIYDGEKVRIGICSFELTVANTNEAIYSARERVLSYIRDQIKLCHLGC